jgi:hypothetical protein
LPIETEEENYEKIENSFSFSFFVSGLNVAKKTINSNIYIQELEPTGNISENAIWIKRNYEDENMIVLDATDSNYNYLNDYVFFTNSGFDTINFFSSDKITTSIKLNNVKLFRGEEVFMLPYKVYVNGEWIETEKSKIMGLKIKISQKRINLLDMNDLRLDTVAENYIIENTDAETNVFEENLNISILGTNDFELSSISENIGIS